MSESKPDINKFAVNQWSKTINYLRKKFNLAEDDCKDIFQESLLILARKYKANEVDDKAITTSTFFFVICRNKAFEKLRELGKTSVIHEEVLFHENPSPYKEDRVDRILALEDDYDVVQKEKEALVRKIVGNLPHPCNELLWDFYGDGESMKVLAERYNYKSVNAVKVTKHRCLEKFRVKYLNMKESLYR